MPQPITGTQHHATVFMKTVAALVITAFLGLTLQPLAIAANAPAPAASHAPVIAPPTSEEQLNHPFAKSGVALAVIVQWFGILFALLLTSAY